MSLETKLCGICGTYFMNWCPICHLKEEGKKQTGLKFDGNKAPIDLVPQAAVEGIARAFGYGATKYGKNNYKGGLEWSRVTAALLRHTFAWLAREEVDTESGLSHLDHMGACVAMLAYYQKNGVGKDDR